jgi:hypothetical protein
MVVHSLAMYRQRQRSIFREKRTKHINVEKLKPEPPMCSQRALLTSSRL